MSIQKIRGFSLVELMVVVAIIGILATIAIPNFTKFQAKAKQSGAKSELTGIYTAERTFFTEYSTFHINLVYIGYSPDGFPFDGSGCPMLPTGVRPVRFYTTGFNNPGVSTAGVAVVPTGAPPITCGNSMSGYTVAPVHAFYSTVLDASSGFPVFHALGYTGSPSDFMAAAEGNISGRTTHDVWTINQDKALANTLSGI